MSMFAPRSSIYEPNFSGLFRLIDDFDKYATESGGSNSNPASQRRARESTPIVTPKFDLQETPNAYILHGELPGIAKKDINIEFTDENTVTIRGKTERSFTHESKDEDGAAAKQPGSEEGKETSQEVVTTNDKEKQVGAHQPPKVKYWVSERSFGEFSRSFNFPSRIDAEGVVAKLDNGILNLVVPKGKKPEGRKITIG